MQANVTLTQQLADASHLLSALRDEAAELTDQLSSAQAALAAKDKLIQQLKGLVRAGDSGEPPDLDGAAPGTWSSMVWAPVSVPYTCWIYVVLRCIAGVSSEAEAAAVDLLTTSSTPSTRSPSKALSRQASRGAGNQHAVSQVSSPTAGGCCPVHDKRATWGTGYPLIYACWPAGRQQWHCSMRTNSLSTWQSSVAVVMRAAVIRTLGAVTHAGGVSLEGVWEAEGPQDRGAQLPTGPGSSAAGGSKAGGGSTAAAAGRQHNQGVH